MKPDQQGVVEMIGGGGGGSGGVFLTVYCMARVGTHNNNRNVIQNMYCGSCRCREISKHQIVTKDNNNAGNTTATLKRTRQSSHLIFAIKIKKGPIRVILVGFYHLASSDFKVLLRPWQRCFGCASPSSAFFLYSN